MLLKRKKIIAGISVLLFCLLAYVGAKILLPLAFHYLGGHDREYVRKIKSIRPGMTEQEIVQVLGRPDRILTKPEVRLTHGKYGAGNEYGKIVRNINKCLVYFHGVDYIGSYFIDKEGKVYFINIGGT